MTETATIILGPKVAAETVCHDEQLQVWAHELLVTLGMGGYFRDFDYGELEACEQLIRNEIKSIVEMAFDHPEAKTIRRR